MPQGKWLIVYASCYRGCRGGGEPGRVLLIFPKRLLEIRPAQRPGPIGIAAIRSRCQDLAGTGLQNPLLRLRAAPDSGFSVTYSLAKYQPATVQVQVIRNPGDPTTPASATTDPNPVFAELQPAGPPPKSHKLMRPKKSKQLKAAAPAPGDPAFPNPNAAPPPAGAASRIASQHCLPSADCLRITSCLDCLHVTGAAAAV